MGCCQVCVTFARSSALFLATLTACPSAHGATVLANDVHSRIAAVLDQVKSVLSDSVIDHTKLAHISEELLNGFINKGFQADLVNFVLAIRYLISSASISKDGLGQPCYYSREPCWAFLRLGFIRKARMLAGATFPDLSADRPLTTDSSSAFYVQSFPRRWPQVNMLPRRILASLGCQAANSSLARMLSSGFNIIEDQCGQKLSIFNVALWRRHKQHSLFRALLPHLRVRPLGLSNTEFALRHALKYVTDTNGLFLEFGVYQGRTLNIIAQALQALGGGRVFGFDSFDGLPEAWANADQEGDFAAGTFKVSKLPEVEPNAELMVGYFNETLSNFLKDYAQTEQVRFVHLDADLYSSTRDVLLALRPYILPGCLMVLDDFVNFPGFNTSGMLAFEEFLLEEGGPDQLEVLGAPWVVWEHPIKTQTPTSALDWDPLVRQDLERAVVVRVL